MRHIEKLLNNNFPKTTIKRGRIYFEENRVVNFKVLKEDTSFVHIISKVEGSYEDFYH